MHVSAVSKKHPSKLFPKDKTFKIIMKTPHSTRPKRPLEDYIQNMERFGVEKLKIHSYGYYPNTCKELNDIMALLCEEYPEKLVGFATAPLAYPEEAAEELDRAVKDLGLKGLKMYPKWQGVTLDADKLKPVYQKASELGIPILTHSESYIHCYTGYGLKEVDDTACNIGRLFFSGILKDFPNLKIIAAHLGGGIVFFRDSFWLRKPEFQRVFNQLYYDIAPAEFYSERTLRMAIEMVGPDRIMFGTDYPLFGLESVKRCIEHVKAYDLPEDLKEKILAGNAMKLLKLEH